MLDVVLGVGNLELIKKLAESEAADDLERSEGAAQQGVHVALVEGSGLGGHDHIINAAGITFGI